MSYINKNRGNIRLDLVFEKVVITFCILIGAVVIFSWYAKAHDVFSWLPCSKILKFNLALILLIIGINLVVWQKKGPNNLLYKLFSSILIFIGCMTFFENMGFNAVQIDRLFIPNIQAFENHGNLSPASALCTILIGVGFLGLPSNNSLIKSIAINMVFVVAIISLIALTAHILLIPTSNKIAFLQEMAIPTSILFFSAALLLIQKSQYSIFTQMMKGKLSGSRIFRKLLPFVILFPIFMSYFLLIGTKQQMISLEFGIVIFTVSTIAISFIYISFIAIGLNDANNMRFQLESGLLQSNRDLKLFKQALDQVSIVALTDNKGVIKYVNDTFCDISQYSRQELIGKTHATINSGYHDKAFFSDMWKTIVRGDIWIGEIKNKAKDGSFYWVHTAIVPFKNDQGLITEYLAIRQDITKRKEAEELLKSEYVKSLEFKNKELEQFTTIASHDLKSPINTIMGLTGLLIDDPSIRQSETSLKYLSLIKDSSSRMNRLIKDLLDYARIDKKSQPTTVDCNQLIADIRIDLDRRISETKTSFSVGELPIVHGHETALRLLFQNLISNAIKFSAPETIPHITIAAQKEKESWHFTVQDNGIGIAEEHKEKIFIIFNRLHSTSQYDGTGIGLAHCKKVVDLHKGKIWVQSEIGKGSTFHIELPISLEEDKFKA